MNSKKYRILLVEDDPELAMVLRQNIQNWGFDVLQAGDHRGAFEKLRNEKFGVLILDIGLQSQSGLRIVDAIKDNPNSLNQNTPIVINSGQIDPETVRKYRNIVDEFFVKPVDMQHFEKRISYWMMKSTNGKNKIK